MRRRLHLLRRRLGPLLRPLKTSAQWLTFLPRRVLGRPSGSLVYGFDVPEPDLCFGLDVRVVRGRPDQATEAADWCRRQTLDALTVTGHDVDGRPAWRASARGIDPKPPAASQASWFLAPGPLPDVPPAWAESALMVAAAERVDAVVHREGLALEADGVEVSTPADVTEAAARRHTVLRGTSWRWDPAGDRIQPASTHTLIKVIPPAGVGVDAPRSAETWNARRRGPYRASHILPPSLRVGLRDVAAMARPPAATPRSTRPTVLVTLSFLAHGGVEHVLFETLHALRDRFDFVIVTLAPHHPDRGDRRAEFAAITDRLFAVGDWVHPAAMYGMLGAWIDHHGIETMFNTNGTTLFYEIAPRLAEERPAVRIIDQLYDYRIGYINWYDAAIHASVDTCVAVNRPIQTALVEERGWTAERAPVIWPCGRRLAAFPAAEERAGVRARVRAELGLADDDLVFVTAARMNEQKRPLDLVRLAERVHDATEVAFVIVGGGELENDVDAAIAASDARIQRLAFRTDIPVLVTAADIGCLVSDFEGLPVFMMECFQGGLPFLGTDVGEMGDVLRTSGAGIVVDQPGDLDALERAVRAFRDPGHRAALAAKAAATAPAFSIETCAARYGDLFDGRLGGRRDGREAIP